MKYKIIELEDKARVVRIEDESIMISDERSALDVFMTIAYETGENRFIIGKGNLAEDFFHLSNKIAGGILQKLINYRMKLAIIGDFSKYDSKALKDFIYECNNGKDIFFVENESKALSMLGSMPWTEQG
ncbi:MAG: DUF4180 domain-containing protein [Peptostreptococcaceae bacterium]|nr:DUF4180 domain-containing protein [Peptostreptococcaceae bacterium]